MGTALYETASDRDLYDHYRDAGLKPDEAKMHVERRRAQMAEQQNGPARDAAESRMPAWQAAAMGLSRQVLGEPGIDRDSKVPIGEQMPVINDLANTYETARQDQPMATLAGHAIPLAIDVASGVAALKSPAVLRTVAKVLPEGMGGRYLRTAADVAELTPQARVAGLKKQIDEAATAAANRTSAEARAAAGAPTPPAGAPAPADGAGVSVEAIRSQLSAMGVPPDKIEAALAARGTPKALPVSTAPPASPVPEMEIPTYQRRGRLARPPEPVLDDPVAEVQKLRKAVGDGLAQSADSPAQLAKTRAASARTADAAGIEAEGFSQADAAEMAAQRAKAGQARPLNEPLPPGKGELLPYVPRGGTLTADERLTSDVAAGLRFIGSATDEMLLAQVELGGGSGLVDPVMLEVAKKELARRGLKGGS